MVALQGPRDSDRPQVVDPAQMQNLLDHFFRRLLRMVMGNIPAPNQPPILRLTKAIAPSIERWPRNTKAQTGPLDVTAPLGILDDPFLPFDFLLLLGHTDPLCRCLPLIWQSVRRDL